MVKKLLRFSRVLLIIASLLTASSVYAGSITFRLSLTGSELLVTNSGDSSAYYTQAFRLLNNGRWEPLKNIIAVAELGPAASLRATWGSPHPIEQLSGLERQQIVMIRFFDQAGVGFGQISFFNRPADSTTPTNASYSDKLLHIEPPADPAKITATWVLAPREDGIAPLAGLPRFEHEQPSATRIDWQKRESINLDTGAALPSVILLHETPAGPRIQLIPGGALQGQEQRTAWLKQAKHFDTLAWIAGGMGLLMAIFSALSTFLRRKPAR